MTNRPKPTPKALGGWGAWPLVLLDGVVFVVAMYRALDFALLGVDGVVSRALGFGAMTAIGVGLLALFALQHRFLPIRSREHLVDQFLGVALASALPIVLVTRSVQKGYSQVWIPLEWHKVAKNITLMSGITRELPAAEIVLVVLFVLAFVTRRKIPMWLAGLAVLGWATTSTVYIVFRLGSSKMHAYLIVFVLPLVLAIGAASANYVRWATRFLVVGAFGTVILYHYVGLVPWKPVPPLERNPGFTKLYPAKGAKPDFLLEYMREFALSDDRRFLYTCYGPSSGMVRIETATGRAQQIEFPGLARYLRWEPRDQTLLSMDWDKGDFLVFSGDPFELKQRTNLLEGGRIAPWSFAVTDQHLYITFHERPILAEYDRATLALQRQISFRDQGFTKFNAGALKVLYDAESTSLYAEVGMTDANDRFLLAKVDPETFTVRQTAVLPEGGLDFIVIPGHQRLVAASFFSNRFYEFQTEPLALVRSFEGPLNSRNVIYDPDRDVLYALAFLPGELWVIDYPSGKPIRRLELAPKAQSLLLDRANDQLYVGCEQGAFRVDLPTWLGATRPRRTAPTASSSNAVSPNPVSPNAVSPNTVP